MSATVAAVEAQVEAVKQTAGWLGKQEFNNILLLLILGSVGFLGFWGINIAIPRELKSVIDGYERQEKSQEGQIKAVVEGFEKALEKSDKLNQTLMQELLKVRLKTGSTGSSE